MRKWLCETFIYLVLNMYRGILDAPLVITAQQELELPIDVKTEHTKIKRHSHLAKYVQLVMYVTTLWELLSWTIQLLYVLWDTTVPLEPDMQMNSHVLLALSAT